MSRHASLSWAFGLALSTVTALAASAQAPAAAPPAEANANPVVAPWSGPYGGVPPFDQIAPEQFAPAFDIAHAEQQREIAAIVADPAPPTFANTILPLEQAGEAFSRLYAVFGVATENVSDDAYAAVERDLSPKLAAANDEVTLNQALFHRVEAVYRALDTAGLTPEQKRLTWLYDKDFVFAGARASEAERKRIGEINQELAGLYADFGQKVLADENTWTVLDSAADLAGLPQSIVDAAKAAAAERKLAGKWVILNTRSSVDPFLTYSSRRELRETVWKKFKNRGDNGDADDTNAVIAKIVKLRAERAHLLGYPTHAHWRMADTMAKDPEAARALMMRVWPAAVARVKEEVADMQAIVDREQGGFKIAPWDYLYYAEKVRKDKYDFDQSEVKPYFELNKIIAASMWAAGRLYGLDVKEVTGTVPVFHPDVRVWEVRDHADGHLVGVFFGDYFARAGKRSGAWETAYRTQSNVHGWVAPLVSNNNNFVKGAPGEPILISLDDATTLFHEFGHAVHDLLSNATYRSLAGTNTPRDFVEFPSQVNEHWLLTRDVLDKFARHYRTGEAMPQSLLDKIERAATFNQGYETVEYLASAIVDLDLHTIPDGVVDPDRFEREDLARIGMPAEIAMRHRLPQFSHLFDSDAYSAGYYSYLWSEVMAADTVQAFVEAGSDWDPATAARLRRAILSTGNMTNRAEAYRQFRGRDPDVAALLAKRGFPAEPAAGSAAEKHH
jgi:peptidyl-dipeptidase Dcp